MTPKEKAIALVAKFEKVCVHSDLDNVEYMNFWSATQSALIAVDEILNNDGFTQFDQYLTEYWQQVKTEIEAL